MGSAKTKQINSVLILDDDAAFRALLVEILGRRGIKTIEARSVKEANSVIEVGDPMLAIVDYRLPEGDGISWISKIREEGHNFSIVFLSGTWCDAKTFSWLRNILKVSLILKKPIDPALFLQQVEGLLPPPSEAVIEDELSYEGVIGAEKFTGLEVEQAISTNDPELIAELKRTRAKLDRQSRIAQVKVEYVGELAEAWQKLQDWLQSAQKEPDNRVLQNEAVHVSHKIYGTAGSLGFKIVSNAAGKIESLLQRLDPNDTMSGIIWSEINSALQSGAGELDAAVRPAAGGTTQLTHSTAVHRVLILGREVDYRDLLKTGPDSSVDYVLMDSIPAVFQQIRTKGFDVAIIDTAAGTLNNIVELTRQLRQASGDYLMPFACVNRNCDLQSLDSLYAGFSFVLDNLSTKAELESLVQELVILRLGHKPRVLSVDDDQILTSFISTVLSSHEINLRALNEPIFILDAMDEFKPDLVLLDVMMPGLSGYDVCRMLRTDEQWAQLPIVFLTSRNDKEGRAAAFQAGGSDFLSKPVLAEELIARVTAQLSRVQMVGRGYHQDDLTGVMTGEAFIMLANKMLNEARDPRKALALCMLGIDDFTHMSIVHGWQAMQDVLRELGALLRCRFRVSDARGRFGEDGFALVFSETDRQTATAALALLQEEFGSIKFTGGGGQTFYANFTVGVAHYPADGDSLQALLVESNKRLLERRNPLAKPAT